MDRLLINRDAFSSILPMHMIVDRDGRMVSCGRTLRRVIGPGDRLPELFFFDCVDEEPSLPDILRSLSSGDRVFLRVKRAREVLLRGHGHWANETLILANFGFGSELRAAVSRFSLTDVDFSAADLAMEVLFLCESGNLTQKQLARFNSILFSSKSDMERLSITDSLTGLMNRRGLERCFARLRGEAGHERGGLVYFDLDNFKAVNDGFGHAVGDRVLKAFADLMVSNLDAGAKCFRIGGDEFAALWETVPGRDELSASVRAIIDETARMDRQEFNCGLSASAGIALFENVPQLDCDALLAIADSALYASKSEGKSTFRFLS